MKKYTQTHEWIDPSNGNVGITAYAIEQLGDIVFLELPEVGRKIKKGEAVAVIESVKSVSDIYAPVSGEVTEVNANLMAAPDMLNSAPETWLYKIALQDEAEIDGLFNQESYVASVN